MMKKKSQRKAAGGADDEQPCRFRKNYCKNVSGDNDLQFCQKHYNFHINFLRNNPSIIKECHRHLLESSTPDLTNINKEEKKMKKKQNQKSFIPPDEERCCRNDRVIWRYKRRRHATDDTKYCEKHILLSKITSSSGDTRDSNCLKRPKKRQLTDQPSTSNPTTTCCARSAKIGAKRKKVERISGQLKSPTGIRETRASKRRRMVSEGDGTSNQPATNDNWESDRRGDSAKIRAKRKKVRRTERSGELKSSTEISELVVELEKMDHCKTKCIELSVELEKKALELEQKELELEKIKVEKKVELEKKDLELEKMEVELEKMKVELVKKKVECTKLQAELAEAETRRTAARDEDASKYWKNKCSDLESLVMRMEIEYLTMRCEASRLTNLESLVLRNVNESSLLRCEELCNSEKI
ncbi:ERC protein 2-like [Papaver somniferum]|uniref:ERC protein 2-like n=1 Tax=Papaver somniferum TaxID=3469 RepID=UPI000E701D1F|nr:ERC protein 2-like [Papaver somniferum]